MNVSSFLDQFESQGASLSRPVLNEGNYKANIVEFTSRWNKIVPTKGQQAGQEIVLTNWGMKLALDSQTAAQIMKQDGDVFVYADQDTVTLGRGSINVGEVGITFEGNIALWNLVGGIFAQVDLAHRNVDDSGAVSYRFERTILESIYQGTEEEKERLESNSEVESISIPARLAELQIKNISELVCSEADTKKVYVHLGRRGNFRDKSIKEHFVKQIILPAVFEAQESDVASIIA